MTRWQAVKRITAWEFKRFLRLKELLTTVVVVATLGAGVPLVIDFHAEATSEKKVMLHHVAGRAAALIGTHTHVQTADETVHRGTAYITDVGMTGVQVSSIGMAFDEVHYRMTTKLPRRYKPATGVATVCAASIDIEGTRATRIERVWAEQDE